MISIEFKEPGLLFSTRKVIRTVARRVGDNYRPNIDGRTSNIDQPRYIDAAIKFLQGKQGYEILG